MTLYKIIPPHIPWWRIRQASLYSLAVRSPTSHTDQLLSHKTVPQRARKIPWDTKCIRSARVRRKERVQTREESDRGGISCRSVPREANPRRPTIEQSRDWAIPRLFKPGMRLILLFTLPHFPSASGLRRIARLFSPFFLSGLIGPCLLATCVDFKRAFHSTIWNKHSGTDGNAYK